VYKALGDRAGARSAAHRKVFPMASMPTEVQLQSAVVVVGHVPLL
jgi:hypothetical protein